MTKSTWFNALFAGIASTALVCSSTPGFAQRGSVGGHFGGGGFHGGGGFYGGSGFHAGAYGGYRGGGYGYRGYGGYAGYGRMGGGSPSHSFGGNRGWSGEGGFGGMSAARSRGTGSYTRAIADGQWHSFGNSRLAVGTGVSSARIPFNHFGPEFRGSAWRDWGWRGGWGYPAFGLGWWWGFGWRWGAPFWEWPYYPYCYDPWCCDAGWYDYPPPYIYPYP
jgi:hypothetical protein